MATKPVITFLVDTRERQPLAFGEPMRTDYFSAARTRRGTLREGDYSVALGDGAPLSIRLERKSLGDLYGCIGSHRERFEAELERLRRYDYRAIIVEASLGEVAAGFRHSRMHPAAVIGSLCSWSLRYHLPIGFAETHDTAAALAQRLLELFAIGVARREKHSQLELSMR